MVNESVRLIEMVDLAGKPVSNEKYSTQESPYAAPGRYADGSRGLLNRPFTWIAFVLMLLGVSVLLTGCGSGGYAGGGIVSLSSSTATIDSGQSFSVNATLSGTANVSWSLAGSTCSGTTCGTVTSTTNGTAVYTAPSGLSSQVKLTLTAAIAGTTNAQVVNITVNPAPKINTNLPAGAVGTPYTATLTATLGTAPLKAITIAGALPAGLTFNASTGVISGTPTSAATVGFTAMVTDSSDVPFTASFVESITITGSGTSALTLNGAPPAGTVGTAYTSTLTATGGTGPYTFTTTAGSLPAGLALSSTGAITGTPTTQGTSTFTAQVKDSTGATATASFSITINSAALPPLTLTTSSLPNGTVGIAYSATIGVTGGTAPYTCTITTGTLPAGLTLGAGCLVSGTPTTAGTSNLTVKVTDSSSTPLTVSGPVSITINPAGLVVSVAGLPNGTVGTPYTATVGVSGGTAPYTCTVTSGSLPAGLTLSSTCAVTGTPTTAGTATFTVKATDASSPQLTASAVETITINPAGLVVSVAGLPNGTVGTPYTATVGVSGGTAPYTCTVTSGSLPAGLTLSSTCAVTGTPTTAGTSTFTVKATDASSPQLTASAVETITIAPAALVVSVAGLPNGTVGTPYTATVGVSGGTAPYVCSVTSGSLPAGLTLSSTCAVTGTPTTAGTSTFTVKATDASSPQLTASAVETITIAPATVTLTLTPPPGATVGTPYTGTIGVGGGTGPYTCTVTAGTLPAGLTLGAGCVITGTPTTAGTTTVTVKATDSSNPGNTTTGPVTLVVSAAPLTLTTSNLPNGMVGTPYTATIGVSGGTSPYSCTIASGTLPAGLTLGAGCVVSGTPTTAGTSTLSITAKDSSSPQASTTGLVTVTIAPATLVLSTSNLPNGTVGTPYSSIIGVAGGTGPYSCVFTAGTLPAGLTLGAGCVVSGTPTVAGTVNLTVKATDSANPAQTVTGPISLTISPAALSLTTTTLPNGTVGTPYTGTVGVAGGSAPYTCTVTSGTLPAGLSFGAGCVVTGTPTIAGTSTVTVKATDTGNPAQSITGPQTITIVAAAPTLVLVTPPAGTVGTPYTGSIGVTGGTGPYSCTINSGALPTGLTLGANCVITGTPTTAGPATVTVTATDSSSPSGTITGPVTLTINPVVVTLTIGTPQNPTVGTPYTGTIPVTGGTGPYTCTIASGALPAGLTLGANCTITGTPTTPGPVTVTITATDSGNPKATTTTPVTITVNPVPPLTLTGSLPNATLNVAYTQTLQAAGGIGPYTYAVTSGNLPAGLTLSSAGVISGTPTAVGASSFTVTATDSEATPQTASLPLVLLVVYPVTPNDPAFKGPYAFLFQGYDDVVAGVLAYRTSTIGSFTADGAGVLKTGELDANHQSSAPTGNTISSNGFVGTYTIGTDYRGSMAITTLNADGTTGRTRIYAIALKAPVAPATVSVRANMIEADDNQLAGTKGSGTILAQTTASFTAGLTGSYAFGLSGDTPCLPACTVGLIAGPVASVGQFAVNGSGAITSGSSDANDASTNYANSTLSGTYGTPDGNGRLALTMATSGVPTAYPTDYAVYMVNANYAFVMSTDKHSSYILLAGSASSQTQTNFSNASMTGSYIGYENSAGSPGLVGATLSNTLNLSTATIFRGTAAGSGTCNTTNIDTGGLTGLVNGLTGLGSGSNILNALLGTYQSTGNSACTVASTGRGVLAYPAPSGLLATTLALLNLGGNPPAPRVVYLTAPNQGYFLETSYAGLGNIEPQSGVPFGPGTFNGTYIYGSLPASSLASIDTSGVITADGAGHATTTSDLNIGVGTLNVIQLGVSGTNTYAVSPNDTTTGRFTYGTYVIYALAPGRFVMLDTNPLTTSPSVALLY